MRTASTLLSLVLLLCGEAQAGLVAEQITDENFEQRSIGGPDAIGGIGDWYLANDVVEIVVDAPGRRHAKLNHGGTIVDAGRLDREHEDQFARLIPIANFSQRVFLAYDSIRAELDPAQGIARLVVTSPGMQSLPRGSAWSRRLDPLVPGKGELSATRVTTVYEVRTGEAFVRIRTRFANRGSEAAPLFSFGEYWMRGLRAIRSFTGHTLDPVRSQGFHHKAFDEKRPSTAWPALSALTFVAAPGAPHFPPISYAITSASRVARGMPFLGLTAAHINVMFGLVGDPPIEGRGLLALAHGIVRGALAAGESWTYERRLLIGAHADVAATTDLLFPMLGVTEGDSALVGRVQPAGLPVGVLIEREGAGPTTHAMARTSGPDLGSYRARVPPGRYRVTLRAPQRAPRVLEVSVPPNGEARVPDQVFAPLGALRFAPAFADGGPGRVVVRGTQGTPDPIFGDELLDYQLDGARPPSGRETDTLYFAGLASDPERTPLAPGRYLLTAVRGLHHDAVTREIEVPGPGAEVRVPPFALTPVVALEGLVAADFHVHAQASDDSATPHEDRLRQFAAEAIDVLVATDHDQIPHYAPALERLGLEGRLRVVTGAEITSAAPSPVAPWSIGHHNAWPIPRQPRAHRRGAPPSQNLSVGALYSLLRGEYGAEVIQLNHARGDVERDAGFFFSHLGTEGLGFDPRRSLDDPGNRALLEAAADGTRAIDFDAMELLNGVHWKGWLQLRRDWYALLRQGYRSTGTANSDTHGPDEVAGFPRNMLWRQEGESFSELVRAGRLFGTNGPLVLRFEVAGARPGSLVAAAEGRVRVDYAIAAASWVPLEECRLIINGELVQILDARSGTRWIELERDGFITLEAGAPLEVSREDWISAHPGLYTEVVAPGHVPVAFTNPVFVDVDGNGVFDPPGLSPTIARFELSPK